MQRLRLLVLQRCRLLDGGLVCEEGDMCKIVHALGDGGDYDTTRRTVHKKCQAIILANFRREDGLWNADVLPILLNLCHVALDVNTSIWNAISRSAESDLKDAAMQSAVDVVCAQPPNQEERAIVAFGQPDVSAIVGGEPQHGRRYIKCLTPAQLECMSHEALVRVVTTQTDIIESLRSQLKALHDLNARAIRKKAEVKDSDNVAAESGSQLYRNG